LCLALLLGGGAVTLWLIAGDTDQTPSSLILPYLAAVLVAAVAAWLIYRWGVRRLAEGKRMPQPATTWSLVGFGVGAAALIRQGPPWLQAAALGFCIGLPATIIFFVQVWPRHGPPHNA
jgi:branched-subunit amino acid ABC-type transport system permease component